MKELKLLQEVIRDLEYLEENKEDRDEMVKKLNLVKDYLKEMESDYINFTFYELMNFIMDFALSYHKSDNKDISNDASMYIYDYVKNKNMEE